VALDYNTIMALIMGLMFVIVPSLILAIMSGFSQKSFMAYLCVFAVIGTTMGILPVWFWGVSILLIGVLFYQIFAGGGSAKE
jgi:ABC-type dipeptide/oligopeptide/nickel transport system permease component